MPILRSISEGKSDYRFAKIERIGEMKRDPNLDNEAVRKYRDIVHLQANWIQREVIAERVDNLRIWESVLVEHMLHGWNPKDVMRMLKTYELERYP